MGPSAALRMTGKELESIQLHHPVEEGGRCGHIFERDRVKLGSISGKGAVGRLHKSLIPRAPHLKVSRPVLRLK